MIWVFPERYLLTLVSPTRNVNCKLHRIQCVYACLSVCVRTPENQNIYQNMSQIPGKHHVCWLSPLSNPTPPFLAWTKTMCTHGERTAWTFYSKVDHIFLTLGCIIKRLQHACLHSIQTHRQMRCKVGLSPMWHRNELQLRLGSVCVCVCV